MTDFELRRKRFEEHLCMNCGAEEEFRSESPDDRFEHSYCREHAPRWLKRMYGEQCKHEWVCKHCNQRSN